MRSLPLPSLAAAWLLLVPSLTLGDPAEVPFPDDPAWRMIGKAPAPPSTSTRLYGSSNGRLFAVFDTGIGSGGDTRYAYSVDAVHWAKVPPSLTGRKPLNGVRHEYKSFAAADGGVINSFGLLLYRGDQPAEWQLIPENQLWLTVETTMLADRLLRIGQTEQDGGFVTIAALQDADGLWQETPLGASDVLRQSRLLHSAHGLVYVTESAWWSSSDGLQWTSHPVPSLLQHVPLQDIAGKGPYMVNFSGTIGSWETGGMRFIMVFARSDDGLNWTDATTPTVNITGTFLHIPPWFSKGSTEFADGVVVARDWLSLDGLQWQPWTPGQQPRVDSVAALPGHRVGTTGSTLYVLDAETPLPAPQVSASSGTNGIQLRWDPVAGAAWYVVQLPYETVTTTATEILAPAFTVLYSGAPYDRVEARVFAVSAGRQPGLPSATVSAIAYSGDLPSPGVPDNLQVTSWGPTSQYLLLWQPTAGTVLHEVAWSTVGSPDTRYSLGLYSASQLLLPMDEMTPCSEVLLWVRGGNGSRVSDWAGPVSFFTTDGGRPCTPSGLAATIGDDGEYFRLSWDAVPLSGNYQLSRSPDPEGIQLVMPGHFTQITVFDDRDTFFDTTYYYRVRSRLLRPPLEPIVSDWSPAVAVSRPPSAIESLTLTVLGWTSLGNGRFSSADFGEFQVLDETSDWIRLADGTYLYIHGVDDALNLQVLLPHPAVGWGLLPRGYWPFLWSPSHKGWFWVAPGGRWVWDYKLQRWHAS